MAMSAKRILDIQAALALPEWAAVRPRPFSQDPMIGQPRTSPQLLRALASRT